jgi:hypothetical protein
MQRKADGSHVFGELVHEFGMCSDVKQNGFQMLRNGFGHVLAQIGPGA